MPRPLSRRSVIAGAAVSAAALAMRSQASEPTTHEVKIRRFTFQPDHLQVRPGDRIIWTNLDIAPHTATADGKSWDTGELAQNDSAEIVVEDGMELSYFCVFHPHMKGTVEIV